MFNGGCTDPPILRLGSVPEDPPDALWQREKCAALGALRRHIDSGYSIGANSTAAKSPPPFPRMPSPSPATVPTCPLRGSANTAGRVAALASSCLLHQCHEPPHTRPQAHGCSHLAARPSVSDNPPPAPHSGCCGAPGGCCQLTHPNRHL